MQKAKPQNQRKPQTEIRDVEDNIDLREHFCSQAAYGPLDLIPASERSAHEVMSNSLEEVRRAEMTSPWQVLKHYITLHANIEDSAFKLVYACSAMGFWST